MAKTVEERAIVSRQTVLVALLFWLVLGGANHKIQNWRGDNRNQIADPHGGAVG